MLDDSSMILISLIILLCPILTDKINIYNNEISLVCDNKLFLLILLLFKKSTFFRFKQLIDIVCFDYYSFINNNRSNRFLLLYNFLSIYLNIRLNVFLAIKEFDFCYSINKLYLSSLWIEREIFDMFGIYFFFNLDLRRILTDYGFKFFPLRKDFPIYGYTELLYNDIRKKISYNNILLLSQELRNFKFNCNSKDMDYDDPNFCYESFL